MPAFVEKMMRDQLIREYAPKRVGVKIPTLSFSAQKKPRLSDVYTEEQTAAFDQFHRNVEQPFFRTLVCEFQSRFPHAKVIVIPDGHHYCFIAQEELVYDEMRRFLLESSVVAEHP
jgi:hypothetical protein